MAIIRFRNGYIFGGFTTIPWRSSYVDKVNSSTFHFTLKNPFGISTMKYPMPERTIRFDRRSDIFLHSLFNVVTRRIFFPEIYKDSIGRTTFRDDRHFYFDDVEVFISV